ncbi:MAG: hypothetical protein AMXMBFR34_12340 [Myxococcaceae bacterium]
MTHALRSTRGPLLLLLAALGFHGCSCKGDLGSLEDARPADLGPTGVVVEQPKAGETLSGAWVSVTGWFDPTKFQAVLVMGAPVDGFYAGTGHVGAPSVPVVTAKSGRFIAPRVPLADGATTLTLLPVPIGGGQVDPITLDVTGQAAGSVPVTVVTRPASGLAPLAVEFTPRAASDAPGWQFDFEADGVFDEQGKSATHTYATPGEHRVLVRTKLAGRWVYGVTTVTALEEAPATHSTTIAAHARWLSVVPALPHHAWRRNADGRLVLEGEPTDELGGTGLVLVADDEGVKAFDAALSPRFTLRGLGELRGVAGDGAGRVWVATADSVRRFGPDGTLDVSFADAGVLGGFRALQGLCVDSSELSFAPDGGLVEDPAAPTLTVLEGGAVKACSPRACQEEGPQVPGATGIRCAADLLTDTTGGVGVLWAGDEARIKDVSGWVPLAASSGWKDLVARKAGEPFPYRVGVDAAGALREFFIKDRPVREVTLPFAAETACVDAAATLFRTERGRRPGVDLVPVVYVAGGGRLERRVLSGLAKGGW